MLPQEIVMIEAKRLLGLKHRDLGRTINGVDCIGYVKLSLDVIGYPFDVSNDYARHTIHPQRLKVEMNTWFNRLPNRMDLKHGDIGMFHEKYHPCHIGFIEVDNSGVHWLLHACIMRKKTLRDRMNPTMFRKLVSTYRLKEI